MLVFEFLLVHGTPRRPPAISEIGELPAGEPGGNDWGGNLGLGRTSALLQLALRLTEYVNSQLPLPLPLELLFLLALSGAPFPALSDGAVRSTLFLRLPFLLPHTLARENALSRVPECSSDRVCASRKVERIRALSLPIRASPAEPPSEPWFSPESLDADESISAGEAGERGADVEDIGEMSPVDCCYKLCKILVK